MNRIRRWKVVPIRRAGRVLAEAIEIGIVCHRAMSPTGAQSHSAKVVAGTGAAA